MSRNKLHGRVFDVKKRKREGGKRGRKDDERGRPGDRVNEISETELSFCDKT